MVKPPDCPILRGFIERSKRGRADLAFGEHQDVVFNVSEATENCPRGRSTFELGPVCAACEPRVKSAMINSPFADHEIEVGGRCWLRDHRHLRWAVLCPLVAGSRRTIVSSHSTQSCRPDLVKAVTQKQLSGRSDEQPRLSNDQAKGRRAFAASGD